MSRFSKNATDFNRRRFLKRSLTAGAVTAGSHFLDTGVSAAGQEDQGNRRPITRGDVAILRFLAAAEILETDLWQQYNELVGVNAASSGYLAALSVLDEDMNQYVSDNTDDEVSHERFLNAYLESKGAPPVDLEPFRTLPSSAATGVQQIGRLTNLMQLTVDTSWWTRYRSDNKNPDLGDTFPQAVPSLNKGQHPAIPRDDDDLIPNDHIQAIANTAGFHFGT